jgi:AraC-like DNA-binding protein
VADGLNKRDESARILRGALLRPIIDGGPIELRRYAPDGRLERYVRHYWFVTWDIPAGESYVQPVLSLPAVNAVVEFDGQWVYGVRTRRHDQILSGRGRAWGILFRPAGFHPFWGQSVHLLQDRRISFEDAFEVESSRVPELYPETLAPLPTAMMLRAQLTSETRDAAAVALLDGYLLSRLPPSQTDDRVRTWVASIEAEPSLTRVEQLAERHQVTVRTMQRMMRWQVGLGPKQVIRRYRLLEAAGRLASGQHINLAQLALELGFADQAHLAREFRAVIGNSPSRQAQRHQSAPDGSATTSSSNSVADDDERPR